jgi:hypothetical protein
VSASSTEPSVERVEKVSITRSPGGKTFVNVVVKDGVHQAGWKVWAPEARIPAAIAQCRRFAHDNLDVVLKALAEPVR